MSARQGVVATDRQRTLVSRLAPWRLTAAPPKRTALTLALLAASKISFAGTRRRAGKVILSE